MAIMETVRKGTARVVRVPKGFDARAATWAGVWAGVVYWALRGVFNIPGSAAWEPFRRFCSVFLKEGALPYPGTFNAIYLVAAIPALAIAVLYSAILADFIHARKSGAITIGAVYGLVLYVINYYLFTGIFPQLVAGRHWTTALCYLVFGAVAARMYKSLAKPTVTTEPLVKTF